MENRRVGGPPPGTQDSAIVRAKQPSRKGQKSQRQRAVEDIDLILIIVLHMYTRNQAGAGNAFTPIHIQDLWSRTQWRVSATSSSRFCIWSCVRIGVPHVSQNRSASRPPTIWERLTELLLELRHQHVTDLGRASAVSEVPVKVTQTPRTQTWPCFSTAYSTP